MDRNEEWQQLIEEYRSVPVPLSVRSGIEDAVARGKKRAVKRRRRAYIGTAVSGAAAVILILVLLPNLNAQMAERMGRVPLVGGFFRAVTVRDHDGSGTGSAADENSMTEALDETADMGALTAGDASYDGVPEVQCGGDENDFAKEEGQMPETACAREVQDGAENGGTAAYSGGEDGGSLAEGSDADAERYTQRLVEHFEAENERGGRHLTLTGYEVVTDSDEWFTLVIYANETADADAERRTYYNVDKRQNALMPLGELYNGRDYVAIISDEISGQIEEKKRENAVQDAADTESGTAETESGFTRIHEDQNYYFNENGDLVIVLDGNQIGSDAAEHAEFVIDVSLLEGAE